MSAEQRHKKEHSKNLKDGPINEYPIMDKKANLLEKDYTNIKIETIHSVRIASIIPHFQIWLETNQALVWTVLIQHVLILMYQTEYHNALNAQMKMHFYF